MIRKKIGIPNTRFVTMLSILSDKDRVHSCLPFFTCFDTILLMYLYRKSAITVSGSSSDLFSSSLIILLIAASNGWFNFRPSFIISSFILLCVYVSFAGITPSFSVHACGECQVYEDVYEQLVLYAFRLPRYFHSSFLLPLVRNIIIYPIQ